MPRNKISAFMKIVVLRIGDYNSNMFTFSGIWMVENTLITGSNDWSARVWSISSLQRLIRFCFSMPCWGSTICWLLYTPQRNNHRSMIISAASSENIVNLWFRKETSRLKGSTLLLFFSSKNVYFENFKIINNSINEPMIYFNILIPYSFGQISITAKYLIIEFKFDNMILINTGSSQVINNSLFFFSVPALGSIPEVNFSSHKSPRKKIITILLVKLLTGG